MLKNIYFHILVFVGLSLFLAPAAMATGQVGEPAAEFQLEDTWGQTHSLEESRQNKVVLLNIMGFG